MTGSLFKAVGKGFLSLTAGMTALASFWIFVIMLVMAGDILGRALFNHPIAGAAEIVRVSIVGIVFLQIPHTLWHHRHVRSTLILDRLGPISREILNLPIYLLGALVFVLIFKSSWASAIESWRILEIEGEGALRVPVYPIRSLILIGSITTVIHFIVQFFQSISIILSKRKKG